MKNQSLRSFYDRVYRKGERGHYTSLLLSGDKVPPAKKEVLKEIPWCGKRVLDAGCGTGELAYLIARRGAKEVMGVDYSQEAIKEAQKKYRHPALVFICGDLQKASGKFDVIVSLGTLEHLNNPLAALKRFKGMLKEQGSLIITCPNWTNPRGYMLMTLYHLFGAKITLADLHHFTPVDFEGFAEKLRMKLRWRTVEHDWAYGDKLIRDFEKRLPNVARDSKLPMDKKRIGKFIEWIGKNVVPLEVRSEHGGAVGLYHLRNS